MPDITELLTLAAGEGHGGPDLAAVERRATSLRRRERVARSAAVLAAALLAVPLLELRGGPDALEQLPADRRTTPSPTVSPATPQVPSTSPARGTGALRGGSAPSAGSPVGPLSRPTTEPSAAGDRAEGPRARPTDAPVAAPTAPPGDFPQRSSCQVATTALGAGEQAVCRFTATNEGGWYFESGLGTFTDYSKRGTATVEISRDGLTSRYDAEEIPCRDTAVLPGDRITITVRQGATGNYDDVDLGAGEGFDCSTTRVRP